MTPYVILQQSTENAIIAIPFLLGIGFFLLTVFVGGFLWAIFTKIEELSTTAINTKAHINGVSHSLYRLIGIWEDNKAANCLYFLKGEFSSRDDAEGVMLIEAANKRLLTKKRKKKNEVSSNSPSL